MGDLADSPPLPALTDLHVQTWQARDMSTVSLCLFTQRPAKHRTCHMRWSDIRAGHQWSSSAGPGHAAAMSAASLNCKHVKRGVGAGAGLSAVVMNPMRRHATKAARQEANHCSPGTHRTGNRNAAHAGTPPHQPDAAVQASVPMGAAQPLFRCCQLPLHLQKLLGAAAAAATAGGAPPHLSRQVSQSSEQQQCQGLEKILVSETLAMSRTHEWHTFLAAVTCFSTFASPKRRAVVSLKAIRSCCWTLTRLLAA